MFKILGDSLTSLILSCSVPGLPVDLVEAIVQTESAGYVYALSGSYEYSNYYLLPKNRAEVGHAYSVAHHSLKHQINISIGLMQVNSVHIQNMKSDEVVVYDPCNNIMIGSAVLKEILQRVCPERINDECIKPGLRQYNTGRTNPSTVGNAYVDKVMQNLPKKRTYQLTQNNSLFLHDPRRKSTF